MQCNTIPKNSIPSKIVLSSNNIHVLHKGCVYKKNRWDWSKLICLFTNKYLICNKNNNNKSQWIKTNNFEI